VSLFPDVNKPHLIHSCSMDRTISTYDLKQEKRLVFTVCKMVPCTACPKVKIWSLSWSLAVKERQYISGIATRLDQWPKLTIHTKFLLFKWAQAED
jgi:hypothetical protein